MITFWEYFDMVTALLVLISGIFASVHALMTKEESATALGWVAVCIGIPMVGVILYLLFGINRITMLARDWETRGRWNPDNTKVEANKSVFVKAVYEVFDEKTFHALVNTSNRVCDNPLLDGCHVQPLYDGTSAYPRMLEAIDRAKQSVYLSTFIFSRKGIGETFIHSLHEAHRRGVEVKVLIDGVGGLYSLPTAHRKLKKMGVPVALFLPPFRSWYYTLHFNLRNHHKILVADGEIAFTGGMNISDKNFATVNKPPEIHDIHFSVEGPVVGQIQDVFLRDWYFSTRDKERKVIYYDNAAKGQALCRGVAAGPNMKHTNLQWMLYAAVNGAKSNIRIMTPYFILSPDLRAALIAASLRGVTVEVILPLKNNWMQVKWASESMLSGLAEYGVRLFYHVGTFFHSKIMLIDDFCAYIGSANLDTRSLRLNFEFNLEVYSHSLNTDLVAHFESVKLNCRPITLEWLYSRPFIVKLRNSFFRLFAPYL
ncbi:phospholipase D-like domain-containing protein [Desulfococcaceae bacterium HSG9]|nr:phospholipase D-like domain-containing protein [Desulfococcaceae bacterium HSG9]